MTTLDLTNSSSIGKSMVNWNLNTLSNSNRALLNYSAHLSPKRAKTLINRILKKNGKGAE